MIAYRVLAPAETVTVATTAYPAAPAAQPGVIGSLPAAPLIVDGRLRLYATTRQVRADGPVDARTQRTPYWSYRRWPEELLGVVAVGTTVVSRWSDGELVALDARTGKVVWRAKGKPTAKAGYDGGSTGAETLYAPVGLYTAGPKVIVRDAGFLRALDAVTGQEAWRTALPGCRTGGFTTAGGQYVATDTCGGTPALEFYDLATGQRTGRWEPPDAGRSLIVEPLGCATAHSACTALRTTGGGGSKGWLTPEAAGGQPVAAPALDLPAAAVAGEVGVAVQGGAAVARALRTGAEIWRWRGDGTAEVLAVQPGAVHLLTNAREIVTLDPSNGAEKSRFVLAYGRERVNWVPGQVRAGDGFVAVERLIEPVPDETDDAEETYFGALPVILART
ncbi:PQQ-binding-like beta-propeller repeat protein [Phytohabitans rumicis]|uniref:outer membrane protein assembly factor BamB family protein n=1 Tax=Phytohabitans rumicis TaxID=1076125 RepID=UPI0031EBD8FE